MICNRDDDSSSDCTYHNMKSEYAYDSNSDISRDDNKSEYSNYALKDIKADFEWIDNEF